MPKNRPNKGLARRKPRRLFAPSFLVAIALVTAGQAADELWTPKHVARVRSVSAVAVSPDGRHVAYTLSVPRKPHEDENGPNWSEIHVVDVNGGSRPFITGEVNVSAMTWTPDGKGISFIDKRGSDKTKCVYVIPVDGGEARRVLKHKTDIDEYSWAPDGTRMLFIAKDEEPEKRKKLKEKGLYAEIFEEDFLSPHVYLAAIGEESAEPKAIQLPGSPSDIVWTRAGSQFAVALAPTPHIDDTYMARKLHVFDADSGSIVSSFKNPGKLEKAVWSPDGKRLAFISALDINDPSAGRLMVANPADGSLVEVLPNHEGDFISIAWQDADTIMYILDEGVWSTFGEIRYDSAERKTHLPIEKAAINSFSLSRDGQTAAMISSAPTHPGEVFVMRHGEHGMKRMTDSNPWLAGMKFAPQEVVTYKARDGLSLQGLLMRPLNEQRGTKYPLIVDVHGGPEAHYTNGWLTRYASAGQVGAAAGFAVFYPNYRGSTGRGVAFSKMGHADAAGKEFDDLIDAVDHLVNMGLVDKAKVGVTGGSYGGYATAWCSTYYSERFAAGVMFVGVSDLVSKSGTTDIPNEEMLVHARKRVWEDWEHSLNRSPIRYVEQAKTPLLILHGKDDPRVHPSQSLELYRHMKVLGQTPVRLVWYPGEGHGNRKAGAKLDYNMRMMQWFEHYLKGPGGPPPPYELEYGFEEKDQAKSDKPKDEDKTQPPSD